VFRVNLSIEPTSIPDLSTSSNKVMNASQFPDDLDLTKLEFLGGSSSSELTDDSETEYHVDQGAHKRASNTSNMQSSAVSTSGVDTEVVAICAGGSSSFAITRFGHLFAWG
jgi:hypothetical protein